MTDDQAGLIGFVIMLLLFFGLAVFCALFT